MKIYRTDKGGIGLWKLSGVVDKDDALLLLHSLTESEESNRGCFILDFENVTHVDYRAFNVLEDGYPEGARVLLSGLSDYILDIFAFVTKRDVISVYPDWKKALRYLVVERGKLGHALAAGSAASK
jgi:anti-anti-sigma regulatory factor